MLNINLFLLWRSLSFNLFLLWRSLSFNLFLLWSSLSFNLFLLWYGVNQFQSSIFRPMQGLYTCLLMSCMLLLPISLYKHTCYSTNWVTLIYDDLPVIYTTVKWGSQLVIVLDCP